MPAKRPRRKSSRVSAPSQDQATQEALSVIHLPNDEQPTGAVNVSRERNEVRHALTPAIPAQ